MTDDDTPALFPGSDLAPGRQFVGRYRIERLLGQGGMGVVFRAHDVELNETVALKILSLAASPPVLDRFRSEVKLARKVTHTNVARTFDIGEADGAYYLTMELVNGESLKDRLARDRMGQPEALQIVVQIAAGLAAAHAAGVVHRDLKPGNVMLAGKRVVITDFGLACATADASVLRRDGAGTPAYMAPEQLAGEPVDTAADIYALGLILWEMLAGGLPFAGDNAMATVLARLHREPPLLHEVAAVPESIGRLVARCLARDPARRFDAQFVAEYLAGKILSTDPEGTPFVRADQVLRPASEGCQLEVIHAEGAPDLLHRQFPLDHLLETPRAERGEERSVTIGRDPANDIVLPLSSVSRIHARVLPTDYGSLSIVDLASVNGLRVNGTQFERKALQHGDVIEISTIVMRFTQRPRQLVDGMADRLERRIFDIAQAALAPRRLTRPPDDTEVVVGSDEWLRLARALDEVLEHPVGSETWPFGVSVTLGRIVAWARETGSH